MLEQLAELAGTLPGLLQKPLADVIFPWYNKNSFWKSIAKKYWDRERQILYDDI